MRIHLSCMLTAVSILNSQGTTNYEEAIKSLVATSNWTEVMRKSEERLQLNPKDTKALAYLGISYANTKQVKQAADTFQKILELEPNNTIIWFNLGLIQIEQKDQTGLLHTLSRLNRLDQRTQLLLLSQANCDNVRFGGNPPFRVSSSVVKSISAPIPLSYPPLAKYHKLQADVLVELIVDSTGCPKQAEYLWGPSAFQAEAKEYAMTMRFAPVVNSTKEVPFITRVCLKYRCDGGGGFKPVPGEFL